VKAVLQTVGKAAAQTARISARVVTRVVVEGGVQIEIPLEQVEPVMTEGDVVLAEPPAEADGKPDPEAVQLELMSNRYLGILQGVSSLQPADLTPGYHMALVLVDNRSGRVIWDAHVFIPQQAREQDFRPLLKDLFRSMPASGL